MTVGKVIQFKILYNIPTGVKRDYGVVYLQSGEALPEAAVVEGWVKLREEASRKDNSEESKSLLEELELDEAKAKSQSKGIWAPGGGKLETAYEIKDAQDFVEKKKGQDLEAIVERIVSGDRMVVRLLLSPTSHIQTMVVVAGIRAPSTKRTNISDGKEQPAEPFGPESHSFVETRLLQRSVKVQPLGVSRHNQLIAIVKHPNGSIADFLLKAGLAHCTDYHTTLLGNQMVSLRQAEKQAKESRLGVFQGHVAAGSSAGETDATITRIQNAEMVYLRDRNGEEKRVNLSSVRQPKASDAAQAPFQADAKEFLRKKLIGKHVKVTTDGKKAASEGYDARDVVTITANNKNIALQLVEAGYASVIRHRKDDGQFFLYSQLLPS